MKKESIIEIFSDILDLEKDIINLESSPEDIDEWDSLQHIMLIMGTEKKFELKLTVEEVAELKDVGEMIDLVIKKLN